MELFEIKLKKQAEKYLSKVDSNTFIKIRKALDELREFKGDIVRLKGSEFYRLKLEHYRVIFTLDVAVKIMTIEEINARTNIKYKRYKK